ncbi:MAG: hypothetical protein HY535_08345 [Chloroflexi bacterium]|nr:hypothetical protein [Chloroflexota bacterium]
MNIYEQWTYDALGKAGFAVFLPYKDRGVDCIVTRRNFTGLPKRVQIKGCRGYGSYGDYAWYSLNAAKVKSSTGITDFWIFVWPRTAARGQEPQFLIVPIMELVGRLGSYAAESGGRYFLDLAFKEPEHPGRIVDDRRGKTPWGPGDPWPIPPGSARDYTPYYNNWSSL